MRALLAIIAATGVASFAADTALYGPGPGPPEPGRCGVDDTRELRWDNGTWKYLVWWYTGKDAWVGNDFYEEFQTPADSRHRRIVSLKIFSSTVAPNEQWDGFNVAFYEFAGWPEPTPGVMIWPEGEGGYFFQPSGATGHVWVEVPINWVTPTASFVAAMEQAYNPPRCDPFAVDTNRVERRHSWLFYDGQWNRFNSTADPYRNLMIRVVMEYGFSWPGVAPTSFGRVKALYY
ncbi:MAG: hypothetical protein JSU81_09055 [Candidatus Coatesbacteria bacterium]|nr:MAG: hypothetical protein JSU81_09055 [Candidatus Coatesbacteria bacterium]